MGRTVNQPSKMQTNDITKHGRCAKRHVQILIPEIPWYHRGHHKGEHWCQNHIEPAKCRSCSSEASLPLPGLLFLESHNRVGFKVAHIHGFAHLGHIWVFSHHQPAHVGEKEASVDVVGVGVGVRELVVDSVVPTPLVDAILESYGLQKT